MWLVGIGIKDTNYQFAMLACNVALNNSHNLQLTMIYILIERRKWVQTPNIVPKKRIATHRSRKQYMGLGCAKKKKAGHDGPTLP